MREIEKAFQDTTYILFGKRLGGIDDYGGWLTECTRGSVKTKSWVSGKEMRVPEFDYYLRVKENVATMAEALELGRLSLGKGEVEELSLENASEKLSRIKTITSEIVYGKNLGTTECCCYGPTESCYRCTFCWWCKLAAYSFFPRTSERVFGCSHIMDSAYCMNCYSSSKLTRCFEVIDSLDCRDSYFCHNCEGVSDSMLCFNAKGLRHAVGNVEYPREQYLSMKKRILSGLVEQLEREKRIGWSIYYLKGR